MQQGMAISFDAKRLTEGSFLALNHSISLIEDATILFSKSRISSSFVLAVMSREEHGRSHMLWNLADRLGLSLSITADQFDSELTDHSQKLRAGISTFEFGLPVDLMVRLTEAFQSKDQARIANVMGERRQLIDQHKAHAPKALHKKRLRAQYVDYDRTSGKWTLPSETDREARRSLIVTITCEIANTLIADGPESRKLGFSIPEMGEFHHKIIKLLGEN